MIVAIFEINKGRHYQTCNSLHDAASRIKSNIDNFIHLLPNLDVNEYSTGGEFVRKANVAIRKGKGMNKKKFIKLMMDNNE